MPHSAPLPRLLAAALMCATAVGVTAAPVLVNFELAPPLTLVGPSQPDTQYTERGFTFTPAGGDAQVDETFCAVGVESCIRNNGTFYLTAFNGATVTVSASSRFTLDSLDASFFPLPDPAELFSGARFGLQMRGTLSDGNQVTSTRSLLEDSQAAGDFIFSSYAGLGAAELLSVTFSACWFDSSSACVRGGSEFEAAGWQANDLAFALDNLSLGTPGGGPGTVPEPSAFWLAALALAGVAVSRRRAAR